MAAWMLVLQKRQSTDWVAEYVAHVPTIIKKYDGKYLGVSQKVTQVENDLTGPSTPSVELIAIFSFTTKDRISEFLACAEYQHYLKLRKDNSASDIFIMDHVITDFP